jgi:hypothetical protein
VTLWSRYGTNFTDRLPKVAEATCSSPWRNANADAISLGHAARGSWTWSRNEHTASPAGFLCPQVIQIGARAALPGRV